jgi:hypothetical protein
MREPESRKTMLLDARFRINGGEITDCLCELLGSGSKCHNFVARKLSD